MKKLVRAVTSVILLACMTAATVFGSAGVESSDLDLIAQNSYQQQAEISASVDSKLTVTVPKKVVLDASESSITCRVNAKGDLEGNKKLIVEPEITKFYLKSNGKSDVEASISQESTEWNWSELATTDASGSVVGKDTLATITYGTLTAGVWKSSFNYNINIVDDVQEPEQEPEIEVDFDLPTEAGIYSISGEKIADVTAEQLSNRKFEFDADVIDRAKAVVIPDGATVIAADRFVKFKNLKMVRIPASVTSLGSRVFKGTALTEVVFEGNVEDVSIEGTTFMDTPYELTLFNENGLFINGNTLVSGSRASGVVNIPDGVSTVAASAFEHNQDITEVNFPKSIKNIADYSFADCGNLAAIRFDAECSGITIGMAAFWEGSGSNGSISDTNSISYVEYPSDNIFASISPYAFGAGGSIYYRHEVVRVVVGSEKYIMQTPFSFNGTKIGPTNYEVTDGIIVSETGTFMGTTDEVAKSITMPFADGASLRLNVRGNVKEFDGVETLSIESPGQASISIRSLGTTETLKNIIIGDGITVKDYPSSWPSSLENIVVSSDAIMNCGKYCFEGVKHIEYHGTDPNAPWGADSMN